MVSSTLVKVDFIFIILIQIILNVVLAFVRKQVENTMHVYT